MSDADFKALRLELQTGFRELHGAVASVSNAQLALSQRVTAVEQSRGNSEERARAAMQSSSDLRAELAELKDAFERATPKQVTDSINAVGIATKAQDKVLGKQTTLLQVLLLLTACATAANGYFTSQRGSPLPAIVKASP